MAAGDSLDLFLQHANKTPTCWLWTARIGVQGHGQVNQFRLGTTAHRAHWILVNGPILPGLVVCHKALCPHKHCVRLSHLYLATHQDNTRDGHRVPYGTGRIRSQTPREKTAHPYRRYGDNAQRFWAIVHPVLGDDCCWLWPRSCDQDGYGQFRWRTTDGHREKHAHRVAWILTYGDIPHGIYVCHRCDFRACVRPSHLWLGTNAENTQDRNRKGRQRGAPKIAAWGRARKGHVLFDACIQCGSSEYPHISKGLCRRCYEEHRRTTPQYAAYHRAWRQQHSSSS